MLEPSSSRQCDGTRQGILNGEWREVLDRGGTTRDRKITGNEDHPGRGSRVGGDISVGKSER